MNLRKPITVSSRADALIIFGIFALAILSFVSLSFEPRSDLVVGFLFFWFALGPVLNLILAFFLVESYLRKTHDTEARRLGHCGIGGRIGATDRGFPFSRLVKIMRCFVQ